MQRIIVKNFGPLKDIDLEIKDYMIFLGPQASGKSTLAKLIYGFKEVVWKGLIENKLWKSEIFGEKNSLIFSLEDWELYFKNYFFTILQTHQKYTITYIYGDLVNVTFTEENGIIKIKFNDLFIETLLNIAKYVESNYPSPSKNESVRNIYVNNEVRGQLIPVFSVQYGLLFIPDERNIKQLEYLNEFRHSTEIYRNNYFQNGIKSVENGIRNTTKFFDEKRFDIIKKYFQIILKGDFENVDGGRISLPDGTKVPLDLASSGQREVVGILLVLAVEILKKTRDFYVIEEPEAHLFPEAQKDITYLISLLANQEGNQVIITTHSHYILGALNILINAHRIGQTNSEEVEKIVPRELWVDKNRIFAGFLENGFIKNIYDDEAEMIKIQQLNAVAGEINKDFDKLLDLEFANENV
jgi:predicted ATPase